MSLKLLVFAGAFRRWIPLRSVVCYESVTDTVHQTVNEAKLGCRLIDLSVSYAEGLGLDSWTLREVWNIFCSLDGQQPQ